MATTVNKRNINDTDIDHENPSKKRKLNEENEASPSISTTAKSSSVSAVQAATTCNEAPDITSKISPKSNPDIKDVNVESNDSNKNTQNDSNNDQNDNTAKSEDNKDTNSIPSNWSFKASDFHFNDNSWVKQTSNASDISNDGINNNTSSNNKAAANGESIPTENTMDSFSEFAGLGFKKVLADQNSQESNKNHKDTEDKDTKSEPKANDNADKQEDSAWGGAWSNSNPDGTFKLSFDWGSWGDSNNAIDLNPSTKVGWESKAPKYDPDAIEEDDTTKQVLKQMTGEQDAGDKEDEVVLSVHCKIYNLEKGNYVERGKGMVNVNTYKVKSDGDGEDKLKGRILCRRDQILTTILNAAILKDMKFEKVRGFIRFGVVEQVKKGEDEEDGGDKQEHKVEGEKKEDGEGDDKKEKNDDKEEKDDDEDEDDDIKTEIKTYLIKPIGGDKAKIDTLLNKIKEIQALLGK